MTPCCYYHKVIPSGFNAFLLLIICYHNVVPPGFNAFLLLLSYKMIADATGLRYHTVNSHLKKIYDKLHVHSATEAVAKAFDEGLV